MRICTPVTPGPWTVTFAEFCSVFSDFLGNLQDLSAKLFGVLDLNL
jgi:hypothetical protein